MEKRELICIGCPLGCVVNVELEDGTIKDISGYSCKRGI
ncbi:MAG: NAD(FAD)-dependent dehydrogenase, partial [Clostridiales bacterium]|nr:NAD(FAD)-dependent dehydrogenase [Clostridiales bacterium]